MNKVKEIVSFLSGNDSKGDDELLMDYVLKDLSLLGADRELTTLYDQVKEKHYTVNLEDIVNAIKKRIIEAISTFDDEKLTDTQHLKSEISSLHLDTLNALRVDNVSGAKKYINEAEKKLSAIQ